MADEPEIELEDNLLTEADFEDPVEDLDEPELSEDEPSPEPAPAPAPQSRGARHFGVLRKENRELKERLARMEGQLEVVSRQPAAVPNRAELERQEREMLEQMSEDQRANYYRSKDRQDFQQALAAQNFGVTDQLDALRFETACQSNPLLAKVKSEVERVLQEQRRQGQNPGRLAVANFLIGQKLIQKQMQKTATQTRNQQVRQRRQTTPANPANTATGERQRSTGKSARDRLEGKTF